MRFSGQATEGKGFANIEDWYRGETGQYLFNELQSGINPILATTFGYYSLQRYCHSALSTVVNDTALAPNDGFHTAPNISLPQRTQM